MASQMPCPNCGNNNTVSHIVTETTTTGKQKGFGFGKACLGFLITGPFGILCGLCGIGKGKTKTTTNSKVVNRCQNCGQHF